MAEPDLIKTITLFLVIKLRKLTWTSKVGVMKEYYKIYTIEKL